MKLGAHEEDFKEEKYRNVKKKTVTNIYKGVRKIGKAKEIKKKLTLVSSVILRDFLGLPCFPHFSL